MHNTIFTNKVTSTIFHYIAKLIFKVIGWEIVGNKPKDINKCVFVAAPHTSNWDFPLMLAFAFYYKIPIYWFGKKELFKFPFGRFMRWMGGYAVDRSKNTNMVDQLATAIKNSDFAYVLIPPEGTRDKVKEWKSGFYHIAVQAEVPILLSFLDFGRKAGGIMEVFTPNGNIEEELQVIKSKYSHIRGKHPDRE